MSLVIAGWREGLDQHEVVPSIKLGLELLAGNQRNFCVWNLTTLVNVIVSAPEM